MEMIQAILLAIVEGITEYLPISSTGHMIIASSIMGIQSSEFVKMFTVAIQFGAILAVVVLYWKRFFQSLDFYYKLFVAFLPAAIIGFLLNDYIDALLENVVVVAISLLLGGIVLLFIDQLFKTPEKELEEITYAKALKVSEAAKSEVMSKRSDRRQAKPVLRVGHMKSAVEMRCLSATMHQGHRASLGNQADHEIKAGYK